MYNPKEKQNLRKLNKLERTTERLISRLSEHATSVEHEISKEEKKRNEHLAAAENAKKWIDSAKNNNKEKYKAISKLTRLLDKMKTNTISEIEIQELESLFVEWEYHI